MSILIIASISFLVLFMLLAIYDGIYLHLWKFELFNRTESKSEHKIHTARAILFPIIIYFLFIDKSEFGFYIGVTFFLIDLIVLSLDAYYEKESRQFMNGLPTSEYIIHLFANSLHFSSFTLIIISKLKVVDFKLMYSTKKLSMYDIDVLKYAGEIIIPGAIFMALLHIILMLDFGKTVWYKLKR